MEILNLCFQDNNADGTSRKGDEEEGSTNVRKIPIGKRFFEFYDAPFTKFWFNTVSLLCAGTYFDFLKLPGVFIASTCELTMAFFFPNF